MVHVKYVTYMDNGIPLSRESELLINTHTNQAVYITDYNTDTIIKDDELEKLRNEDVNLFGIKRHFQYTYIYTDFINNQISAVDWISSKSFLHTETIPSLHWQLTNETKVINNYNCNSATISFRGRNYIAWYSKDIPLTYGPWKFSGLPGLILEIQDTNKNYTILAKEVNFKSNKKIEKIPTTDKTVTLKEFVSIYDEYYNPNNWSTDEINITYKEYIREGMELIYEWEEGTKN